MSEALHDLAGREVVVAFALSLGVLALVLARKRAGRKTPAGIATAGAAAAGMYAAGLRLWELPDAGAAWTGPAVAAAAVGGGILAARSDRRLPGAPALVAVSVAGLYLAVPDTEAALPLLGAALPLGLASAAGIVDRLGRPGAAAWVALTAWVAWSGGVGRHGSLAASLFLPGLLLAVPFAMPPAARRPGRTWSWWLVSLHIVTVVVIARGPARASTGLAGAAGAAAVLLASAVVVAALGRLCLSGRGGSRPPRSS